MGQCTGAGKAYSGLSTEPKPTGVDTRLGDTFFETNTGKFSIYNGTSWVLINP